MKQYTINNENIIKIISNDTITSQQKILLIAIIIDVNNYNTFNVNRLSRTLKISTSTIHKTINDLKEILKHRKMNELYHRTGEHELQEITILED